MFNGREPDPLRTNFDFGRLDAVAGRISIAVNSRLTFQVSAGHLPDAEAGPGRVPRITVTRVTASTSFQRETGTTATWAGTVAYGVNSQHTVIPTGRVHQTGHALMVETSMTARQRSTVFGRAEIVGKPAHDFHADQYAALVFPVGKMEGGFARSLPQRFGFVPSVGGVVMLSVTPTLLSPYTAADSFQDSASFSIFVRLLTRWRCPR